MIYKIIGYIILGFLALFAYKHGIPNVSTTDGQQFFVNLAIGIAFVALSYISEIRNNTNERTVLIQGKNTEM